MIRDPGDPIHSNERGLRLDAYLTRAGLTSRKEARTLIRRGAVRVDGEVCLDAQRRIRDEHVSLGERPVVSPADEIDLLMHKPTGVACSRDEREAPLVYDLLDDRLRRRGLRIAGRLDRATSGLLVLTVDGDLVHRLTHPTRKLPKRYRVHFTGRLAPDAVERCREGIVLQGDPRPTRPADLLVEAEGRATLMLREGRTHQVRRMFRALGAKVVALHRDRLGGLDLPPDLAPGDFRPLRPEERARALEDPEAEPASPRARPRPERARSSSESSL